ncbi:MAG TPA: hypothetical protein VHD33_03990 [Legionellaceae bacterium]|nr:hypothetical protein [Legionellaceae bacterium]
MIILAIWLVVAFLLGCATAFWYGTVDNKDREATGDLTFWVFFSAFWPIFVPMTIIYCGSAILFQKIYELGQKWGNK